MKDKQFLEHLNLYLDGTIDPADAAELEREILSNPTRRRVFNDYCRIHRATKLIYQQFRTAGAASDASALPPGRIRTSAETASDSIVLGGRTGGRAAPRPFRLAVFASGLAAACAVGIFIGTKALAPNEAKSVAPAPAIAVVQPAPATPLVVEVPASDTPATFAAPFAPETRQDPFVQFAPTRGDPFALTPWTVADDTRVVPPSLSNPPTLKIDPRFRPAGLESHAEPQGTREHGPFRLRVNGQTTTHVPAGFSPQP